MPDITSCWDVVFFSGTGGTEYCAHLASGYLAEGGSAVAMHDLGKSLYLDHPAPNGLISNSVNRSSLVLLFPVYAAAAASPIHDWLNTLADQPSGEPLADAVVLSVSGGGSIFPNNDSRRRVTHILKHKGYRVVWDDMLIMPSNWTICTPPQIVPLILKATERKLSHIFSSLASGATQHSPFALGSALISWVSALERRGAKIFGRHIKVSAACTSCGWCVKNCPRGNIHFSDNKLPMFSDKCVICMRCLYGCPVTALTPSFLSFFKIPQGFTLCDYRVDMPVLSADLGVLRDLILMHTKGLLWIGVRNYLLKELL